MGPEPLRHLMGNVLRRAVKGVVGALLVVNEVLLLGVRLDLLDLVNFLGFAALALRLLLYVAHVDLRFVNVPLAIMID